jgi:hypothetical protein
MSGLEVDLAVSEIFMVAVVAWRCGSRGVDGA